jgi:rhamnosyltransferase
MKADDIGVVIPTRNAGKELRQCLEPVLASRCAARVLVIDTESRDGTPELARSLGCEVVGITKPEFGHGRTRERARRLLGTPFVVFLTQDAVLVRPDAIAALVEPLRRGDADVAYGRQLARAGADVFEALPREFNYPPISSVRSIADVGECGVFTFFCSNSFSAYRQESLDRVGGFPDVLTNEDYIATALMLQQGMRIAYVAEAEAWHSHRFTLAEEFRRFYDTGFVRGERPWIQDLVGAAEGRGAKLSAELLRRLARTSPWMIPYGMGHLAAKWLGFRAGFLRGRRRARQARHSV